MSAARESVGDREARERLLALEQRIGRAAPALPPELWQLYTEIQQILERACKSGRLKNSIRELEKSLLSRTKPDRYGVTVIAGGLRTERWSEERQFVRDDQACFNFSVTVQYPSAGSTGDPELIAYHFNLAFPNASGQPSPAFVRFDLNDAEFTKGGVRDALRSPLLCHAHPGHGKMTIPTPVLAPQEILAIFLHEHLRP